MKIRRAVYVVLGCIFILLNILIDIVNPDRSPISENENGYAIGYFIGSHFLIIFGLIFLGLAFKVHKKIKAMRFNELEKNIDEIGNR